MISAAKDPASISFSFTCAITLALVSRSDFISQLTLKETIVTSFCKVFKTHYFACVIVIRVRDSSPRSHLYQVQVLLCVNVHISQCCFLLQYAQYITCFLMLLTLRFKSNNILLWVDIICNRKACLCLLLSLVNIVRPQVL